MSIKVLIVDDQSRARRSLKALLTAMRENARAPAAWLIETDASSVEIVGDAENGEEAVERAHVLRPDVVVMDLNPLTDPSRGPSLDGLATIRLLKSDWPSIRIVVLTLYATERASLLAAGADAFLLKGCPTSELLDAVTAGVTR